ncbi:hypothetical protein DFH05DRAFT_1494816 [Lentinula detonsa]|uniref:Zn(2)-C6 fungal-type domain-containing protein n=1 Tax=Lentinula detonsa TaxID=2804962 RepID=A0A9W8P0S0_9AGAR|nr:hypothetical protein DFH05DRAFT_1494816 [Lentinula detonsa]
MYSKKTPQAPPIPRGGACNNCKRRKMRCDGQRPICGPCSRSSSLVDCQYGRTHADRLQEQISVLETRLEQLQNGPNDSNTRPNPLVLHDPYASRNFPVLGHNTPTENELIEAFLPYTSQLGFFLNAKTLLDAFSNPMSDPTQRPTHALSASMVLLGAYFSRYLIQNSSITLELIETYLSKAVQATSLGLSEMHPQRILHTLQANIVIAHYFFLHNRVIKGKWHLDHAVSLVLSARLHQIRSSLVQFQFPNRNIQNVSEEGEQINAMWTVLALNCLWSAAEGIPASIAYTTEQRRIDTPWPLDSGSYSETTLPPSLKASHTIQKFLSGIPDEGNSILALHAKATILFEQTTVFWKRYTDGTQPPSSAARTFTNTTESRDFQSSYQTLSSLLTHLLNNIPPVDGNQFRPYLEQDTKLRLLTIHIVVRVTIIRLQCTFSAYFPFRGPVLLEMANGIMECLTKADVDSIFLDPIMAVLLRAPAAIFMGAIRTYNRTGHNSAEVQNHTNNLNQIKHLMARYSNGNPLMASKLLEIDQQLASLNNTMY